MCIYMYVCMNECMYVCMYVCVGTGSSVAALVVVGAILYVLGLTEYLVALFVFRFCVIKRDQGEDFFCTIVVGE